MLYELTIVVADLKGRPSPAPPAPIPMAALLALNPPEPEPAAEPMRAVVVVCRLETTARWLYGLMVRIRFVEFATIMSVTCAAQCSAFYIRYLQHITFVCMYG